MQAITVTDREAGVGGLSLTILPHPVAAENDVVVRVHAAGFTPGEFDWPHTWTDRAGRDRTPSVPGHELSGVVVELGYGTTGLSVGQRVFGLADWAHNGSLAEYAAMEARNLAPLPMDVDHIVGAAADLGIVGLAGSFRPRPPHDWTNGFDSRYRGLGPSRCSSLARSVRASSVPAAPGIEAGRGSSVLIPSSTWRPKGWRMPGKSTWCST
jgi:threonine dehydrogenase-like Zn-dependent dehydrogenase